jgi:hypothetical protein
VVRLLARRDILVHPTYRMFVLHDPECDDGTNFDVAFSAAIADIVGWAYGMVAVATVREIGNVAVSVEVWDADPGGAVPAADVDRSADLDFPSGQYCIDKAEDRQTLGGVDLPQGPGMYHVHVTGQRAQALLVRNHTSEDADPTPPDAEAAEQYLFRLWRIADSPADPDAEEWP